MAGKETYNGWLHRFEKDYRNIVLQDKSQWTLRLSENDDKFIHIHPARGSLDTIRVRAVTLQTAIAAIILSRKKSASPMDINIINKARKMYLGESPVRILYKNSGLGKLILLLGRRK